MDNDTHPFRLKRQSRWTVAKVESFGSPKKFIFDPRPEFNQNPESYGLDFDVANA